jgi:hypothetical protein
MASFRRVRGKGPPASTVGPPTVEIEDEGDGGDRLNGAAGQGGRTVRERDARIEPRFRKAVETVPRKHP